MSLIYREYQKSDGDFIKKLIDESFHLGSYVGDKSVLASWLNVYLYSCLAEQTFTCVAENDGEILGVIMGKAQGDYKFARHLKPAIALSYHTLAMGIKGKIRQVDSGDNRRMHKIYSQLIQESGEKFDGVLTLFAVSKDSQGLGIGKELLRRLLIYEKNHGATNIYLHTDSACNYGFYESRGFVRLGAKEVAFTGVNAQKKLDVFLYSYNLRTPRQE